MNKGSNTLCDVNGNVKLADFGASKFIKDIVNEMKSSSTSTKKFDSFIGTPHFMSPEVIKGEKYGRKVDIWSLGCTVIEMLTGKPPWHDLEHMQVVFKIFSNETPSFKLPDNVSQDAIDFLNQTFCFDYEKRPTASELLLHKFILNE